MTLYETIFTRRSVRKYLSEPLNKETLDKISEYLNQIQQLEGLKADFSVVSASAVGNDKAPHYILVNCPKNALEYINAGYFLQSADLYLQNIGLGTLWLGMAKPKKDERDDFCIMLALGKTDVPCRNNESDFNRLPMDEIANVNNAITRAARLAPSAMNNQPWKIDFKEGMIIVDYRARGIMAPILKRKLSKIDMGIVLKHIQLALINEGYNPVIKPFFKKPVFWTEISYAQTKS